jgi:hypothetical protein
MLTIVIFVVAFRVVPCLIYAVGLSATTGSNTGTDCLESHVGCDFIVGNKIVWDQISE